MNLKNKTPELALKNILIDLREAFAIAILFKDQNLLVGSRKGSPLKIGLTDTSFYLGSESLALSPFTQKIVYMKRGIVFLFLKNYKIYNSDFKKVVRQISISSFNETGVGKGISITICKRKFLNSLILLQSLSRFLDPTEKINMPELKIDGNQLKKLILLHVEHHFMQVKLLLIGLKTTLV